MQNSKQLRKHKRSMNRVMTPSEELFEAILVSSGIDYKPQMILGFYILDFCIPGKMLDIEIDGSFHDSKEQREYDVMRDKFTEKCGFKVIRILNNEVLKFDINHIFTLPDKTLKEFRSGLAKANSLRSTAILKHKK